VSGLTTPTTEISCAKTGLLQVVPLFDEKIDSMLSPDGVALMAVKKS
jgi:hypothetical protein